jgi:hypothetical protein
LTGKAAEFLCERRGRGTVRIVKGRDVKTLILQAAGHVRPHSADSNKSDVHAER